MLEIKEHIQKEVDELIDSSDHHDFYDFFIKRVETPKLRALNDRKIIFCYFNFPSFFRSEFSRELEKYGEEGIKCFFLHIFLDEIERRTRKDSPDIIKFDVHGSGSSYYRYLCEEVKTFVEKNYDKILEDVIEEQYRRRRDKKKIVHQSKGYKSAVLSVLFRGMRGVAYSYGPKPAYYKRIVKELGVDHFLEELRTHGDYSVFINNLLKNFDRFYDEVFPEAGDFIERYTPNEIVTNEDLLKELLKRIFKVKR
jgi:hypothetical protein